MRRLLISMCFILPTAFLAAGIYLLIFGFQTLQNPIQDYLAELPVHHINGVAAGFPMRAVAIGIFFCVIGLVIGWKWRYLKTKYTSLAEAYVPFRANISQRFRTIKAEDGKLHWTVFFVLLLYGIVIRVLMMNVAITYDEAFSFVHFAQQPWTTIISDYSFPNNHVLHTLLMKASVLVFGVNEWGLRLPALLFGITLLPVSYLTIRSIFNKHIALLSFAFFCSSNVLIEYGTEARGYGMWVVFFMISLWAVHNYIRNRNTFNLVLFGVASILAFYATPAAIYSQGFVTVLLLWDSWKNKSLAESKERVRLILLLVGIALITIFCYHPILVLKGQAGVSYHPHMGVNTWEIFSWKIPYDLHYAWYWWSSDYMVRGLHYGLGALFLLGVVVKPIIRKWLLLSFAVAIPLVLIQMLIGPARVWTYIYIIFVVGVVSGGYFIWEKLKLSRFNAVLLIVALAIPTLWYSTWHGDLKFRHAVPFNLEEAAIYLHDNVSGDERIRSQFPNDIPLEYYYIKQGIPYESFRGQLKSGSYLYIVVNPYNVQSPSSVIEDTRSDAKRLGEAELVHTIGDLKIYRCEVYP